LQPDLQRHPSRIVMGLHAFDKNGGWCRV
jgi:hypothetical protein